MLIEKNYPHHGAVCVRTLRKRTVRSIQIHRGSGRRDRLQSAGRSEISDRESVGIIIGDVVKPRFTTSRKEEMICFLLAWISVRPAVKLLLMDEHGKIHKIVSKEYPLYFPHPGWSEQKPEDWFEQSMEGLKELTAECDKSQVKGISFGGQMHGLVALDKDDNVIRPAILWNDGRTGKRVEYLNNVIGKDKLSKYTANIAFAGFTAPKILWMKENEPDNFARS